MTGAVQGRVGASLLMGGLVMLAVVASGAAGHGPTGMVLAASGFVLARIIGKPVLVTQALHPGGLRRLVSNILGQLVLVLVLFWLGIAIGIATGWAPRMPVWVPLVSSLAVAVQSRLIWPRAATESQEKGPTP